MCGQQALTAGFIAGENQLESSAEIFVEELLVVLVQLGAAAGAVLPA